MSDEKKQELKDAKAAAKAAAIEAAKDKSKALTEAANAPWGSPVRPLPRFEIGLATRITQEWRLLGYERGDLVGSISLEPGAEASLEVFTWERLRIERDEQTGTTFERGSEVSGLSRTTSNIAVEAASELGTTMSAGGSATLPVEAVRLGASFSGSTDLAISTSVQSGLERIVEATSKSTTRFQMTHQVKVVHTTERGTETRATRKLTNPNPGRVLEFLHFEICARHRIITKVDGPPRLVVFVENPSLGAFEIPFIFAHEHVLKAAILSADYQSGFEAARTLQSQGWFEASLRKREAEAATALAAGLVNSPPPEDTAAAEGVPLTGIYQTARQIQTLLKEFIEIDLATEADVLFENLTSFGTGPSKARVKKAEARFSRWGFWVRFSAAYPGVEDRAQVFTEVALDGPGHASEEEVVAALQQLTDGLDDDWLTAVKMIAVAVVVGVALSLMSGPVAGILQPFLIGLLLLGDDMGLPAAITRARRELPGERALQQGQALVAPAEGVSGTATTSPAAQTLTAPQIVPDIDLARANADYEKLRLHLEAHRSYYENAIWSAEDPNDRFVRLEVAGVAPYVDNVLLGFVGNRAMYPLRLAALPAETQADIQAICGTSLNDMDYGSNFSIDDQEVSLPTPAVHTQGYVDSCDLLEPYMKQRRRIDLRTRKAAALRERARALQEMQEVDRLEARLAQTPPMLDPPCNCRNLPVAQADGSLPTPPADVDLGNGP